MTDNQLAKELIKEFGPLGAPALSYEKYLHVERGSLPRDLERVVPPGPERKRPRYCPYAVARWANQNRIPGYYANLVRPDESEKEQP